MQAARDIQWEVVRGDDWTDAMLKHAAAAIDAHTAEALSEHKRVLDEAGSALIEAYKQSMPPEVRGIVKKSLTAIAELKTNEKVA